MIAGPKARCTSRACVRDVPTKQISTHVATCGQLSVSLRTMDDEDAEYMQGSDDEVRALSMSLGAYSPFKSRTTGLTTQMEKAPTMP